MKADEPKMKVIFLDVDGVLNSDEYMNSIKHKNVIGVEREIDINKVKLLKQAVYKTGAKVVMTSSIRHSKLGRDVRELLLREGMLVDVTPFLDEKRGYEIKTWIKENTGVEDFVILDDEVFESYDETLLNKLIKISDGNGMSFGEGLQPKDVSEIIRRLGERQVSDEIEL